LQEEARKLAIDEAQEKAERLAEDLDVELVRIVNFSENGFEPQPFQARAFDTMESTTAVAPVISTGENRVVSNVMIHYEIR